MEQQLRRYMDGLFEETKPTKKAIELKEEMIQNLEDKYRDLIADGKTPEMAFNIAIAGIGDVSNLFEQLEEGFVSEPEREKQQEARQKSALLTAVAVMMYILSALPLILLGDIFGLSIMLTIVAIATGLLIYNNMTKPRSYKDSETIVEEFMEWQTETHERKQMRGAVSTALWSLILAIYFIVSFWTFAWYITWVIFIIGGLIESLINIFFAARKKG